MNRMKEYLRRAKEAVKEKLGKAKAYALPAFAMLTVAVAMSPVAHASEDVVTDSKDMNAILASVDVIISLMGRVWDVMTSNPLLTFFLAVSLLTVGVRVFRKFKTASR